MHVDTLTMSTAAVRTGDTSATLAFESRETRTLTGRAIANSFVAALAVEVGLIPGKLIVRTGETVRVIVLFANKAVGVLVLNLLVCVDSVVGIDVAERRVDKRFAVQAQALRAIISQEVEFTFAHTSSIADAVA